MREKEGIFIKERLCVAYELGKKAIG